VYERGVSGGVPSSLFPLLLLCLVVVEKDADTCILSHSIQIILECTSRTIFIKETSANQHFSFPTFPFLSPLPLSPTTPTATLPGDIPLQILLLQKYLKSSFDIIGFLAPEIAIQILSKLSVTEVVRAGLVSVLLVFCSGFAGYRCMLAPHKVP
jgi:hypothetical protein